MDPANPTSEGTINPSGVPSDFQANTKPVAPPPNPIGSDLAQPSSEPPEHVIIQDTPREQVSENTDPLGVSGSPVSPPAADPIGIPPSSFPPTSPSPEMVPPAVPPQDPLLTGEPMTAPQEGSSSGGSKKIFLLGLVGLLLLGTIAGGIYLASRYAPKLAEQVAPSPPPTATPAPVVASAEITYLEGTAWNIGGEARIPLTQGQSIAEGATTIETEEDAKVLLTLGGGSILRIGPSSRVTLTSLDPEAMNFTHERGIVYAYVDDAGTGTFSVIAGAVTIEATGTAFSAEKDESVLVNVYQNKVKVIEEADVLEVAENKQFVQGATSVASLDTTELETDNFLQWALEEELKRIESEIISQIASSGTTESREAYKLALEGLNIDKKELIKQAYLTSTSGEVGAITLTGQKTPEGAVSLSWTADGLVQYGYKVVWSTTPREPYPGDKRTYEPLFGYAKTLGPMKSGRTWYYRVCEWTGTTCGVYSNELSFSF